MTPMSPVCAAFKMESCILPTVFVFFFPCDVARGGACFAHVAVLRRSLPLRCFYVCCVYSGVVLLLHVHACFVCFCFVFFGHGQSSFVLFGFCLSCLPSLSSFSPCLCLFLCLSLSPPASAVGMGLIYLKRNAWTQTLERWTSLL